jgi:hypothetical protein
MFINMIAVNMMQMAIMQIIGVAVVLDGRVAAAGAVDMGMIVVDMATHGWAFRKGTAGSPGNGCFPTSQHCNFKCLRAAWPMTSR